MNKDLTKEQIEDICERVKSGLNVLRSNVIGHQIILNEIRGRLKPLGVELSDERIMEMSERDFMQCFLQKDVLEQRLDEYTRSMEQAKADYENPFEYEEELKQKLARQYEINAELDLDRDKGSEDMQEEKTESKVAERDSTYQTGGHTR